MAVTIKPMNLNISMWAKALRVIPRVSKKEWQELDPVAKWLIATRSAVFIMTAFSVLVGGLLLRKYYIM